VSNKIAVNLPVKDLAESTRFFAALGFPSDKRLANENIEAFVISDDILVLLVDQSQSRPSPRRRSPTPPPRARRSCSCRSTAANASTNSLTRPSRQVPCPRMSRTTKASSTDEAFAISTDPTGTCSASTMPPQRSGHDPASPNARPRATRRPPRASATGRPGLTRARPVRHLVAEAHFSRHWPLRHPCRRGRGPLYVGVAATQPIRGRWHRQANAIGPQRYLS
jgi:catechol 2,3-dioxygenase-like lactoylglutathione lyase family enzyme